MAFAFAFVIIVLSSSSMYGNVEVVAETGIINLVNSEVVMIITTIQRRIDFVLFMIFTVLS
ncbi:hypothetical protein SDC9_203794 [bioreactor metagenome]|uniref:Uncharacterized protein n=1 Tax=bioreactor metagenome TaxID=1076179 RepID=A0A645IXH1_9ZZZZ